MSAQLCRATREAAIAAATEKGCIIVEPKPNELFIDVDSAADFTWLTGALERIKSRTPIKVTFRASPSLRAYRAHVVVAFEEWTFTPFERIAFQAALGSDRGRELNSVCDVLDGDPLPTIFFEKPEAVDGFENEATLLETWIEMEKPF